MDTPMIWRLAGAFINVTLLSRGAQLILRRRVSDSYKRAYLVVLLVAVVDFAGVWVLYRNPVTALYIMLFYYLPILIMWFLKDILDASRERGRVSGGAK